MTIRNETLWWSVAALSLVAIGTSKTWHDIETTAYSPEPPEIQAIVKVNPTLAITDGDKPLTFNGFTGTYRIDSTPSPVSSTIGCVKVSVRPNDSEEDKIIFPQLCG